MNAKLHRNGLGVTKNSEIVGVPTLVEMLANYGISHFGSETAVYMYWEQSDGMAMENELSASSRDETNEEESEDEEQRRNPSSLDLQLELIVEALTDRIRESFAYSCVFDEDDLEGESDWIKFCTDLVEEIDLVDEYLAPKLLNMSGPMVGKVARLIINLGRLAETIGRTCRPVHDLLDDEVREAFLLSFEKQINELEH